VALYVVQRKVVINPPTANTWVYFLAVRLFHVSNGFLEALFLCPWKLKITGRSYARTASGNSLQPVSN